MDRGQPCHYSNLSRHKMELLVSPVWSPRSEAVVHPSPAAAPPSRLPPIPVPAQGTLLPASKPAAELSHSCAAPLQLRDFQPWSPI